jgi:hypothetical protein
MRRTKPTGRWRHRLGYDGCLILQIEEEGLHTAFLTGRVDTEWVKRWRDATVADITLSLSPLPNEAAA